MIAYSRDLRERVLAAVDAAEGTQQEIARRFRVSARWIRKMLALRARTGSVAPKPKSGGRKLLIQGATADALKEAIHKSPDATLEELRQATGFNGCLMTVWRAIERLKITRKKSRYGRRSSLIRKSPPSGRRGASGWARSTRTGSSSALRATPRRP
jgi:transposase